MGASVWVELAVLLVLPVAIGVHFAGWIDWRVFAGAAFLVSIVAYVASWSDKRRAEAGDRRLPEAMLHFLELLGGWPGAFLAQRQFRHKTSKASYQIIFWMIVLCHQVIALDCLIGWRLTRAVVHFMQSGT